MVSRKNEFGEEVGAFVVTHEGGIKPDDLMAWCRKNLSRYKLPREIFLIDDLPKSGVGKVLKSELVDMLEPID